MDFEIAINNLEVNFETHKVDYYTEVVELLMCIYTHTHTYVCLFTNKLNAKRAPSTF